MPSAYPSNNLLACCILLTAIFSSCDSFQQTLYNKYPGKVIENGRCQQMFAETEVEKDSMCALLCQKDESCVSFNAVKMELAYTCQMFNVSASDVKLRNNEDSSTYSVYLQQGMCLHGGEYFHETQSCICGEGFDGTFCETKERKACPVNNGYRYNEADNVCYKIYGDFRSFYDAKARCSLDGAHLLRIENEGEWLKIKSALYGLRAPIETERYFIDGTEEDHYGLWTDTDGAEITWYKWNPGEPNSYSESCIELMGTNGFTYNDIACWQKKKYICQIDKCLLPI